MGAERRTPRHGQAQDARRRNSELTATLGQLIDVRARSRARPSAAQTQPISRVSTGPGERNSPRGRHTVVLISLTREILREALVPAFRLTVKEPPPPSNRAPSMVLAKFS